MTNNPTDPNKVLLTGENSFIRLSKEEGGPLTTRVSHWRILFSPGGPGHVLFMKNDMVNDEVRIYSDNIAMTRWLQATIMATGALVEFAGLDLPVIQAEFDKTGDTNSFWIESVESAEEMIALTWYDFLEPIMWVRPVGSTPGRNLGVYSCFIPARRAQMTINGKLAQGNVYLELRAGKASSTACLAWSETWVGS